MKGKWNSDLSLVKLPDTLGEENEEDSEDEGENVEEEDAEEVKQTKLKLPKLSKQAFRDRLIEAFDAFCEETFVRRINFPSLHELE